MGDFKTIGLVLMLIIIGFEGTSAAVNCTDNAGCRYEETCESGTCTCPANLTCDGVTCTVDAGCENGKTCESGTCTCPANLTCDGVNCTDNAGCRYEETCESGTCTCPANLTCDGVNCTDNAGCRYEETCESGTCTCPANLTCDGDCTADGDCMNDGTCAADSTCTCTAGFTGATCDDAPELSSVSAAIKVSGVEYTSALGDTSTPEFMEHAELWEERIAGGYCNATADLGNGTACQIMVNVTGFSNGSLVVHFTAVFESSVGSTLNAFEIQILDANGIPYDTTVSGVTLICNGVTCANCTSCSEATTPATKMQGTLQCYSCSTSSISDVCSTADDLASADGVSTVTCYEEQRCWTYHYENSSHTVVSRGCTDHQCNIYHEGGGPYCTMANGVTNCTSCCTESKCNDNKSSSEGLTCSCVTWLTSLFSVVIMLITYRT